MASEIALKRMCICAAAGGALLATGIALSPLWARDREVVVRGEVLPTKIVKIADLNLLSSSGQAAIHSRVRGAVRILCGPYSISLREEMARRGCTTTAYDSARPQIEAAIQNARFASRKASSEIVVAAVR